MAVKLKFTMPSGETFKHAFAEKALVVDLLAEIMKKKKMSEAHIELFVGYPPSKLTLSKFDQIGTAFRSGTAVSIRENSDGGSVVDIINHDASSSSSLPSSTTPPTPPSSSSSSIIQIPSSSSSEAIQQKNEQKLTSSSLLFQVLTEMGFSLAVVSAALEISPDDFDLAVEICRNMGDAPPTTTPHRSLVARRVIPADNSCLFNAIGFLLPERFSGPTQLRQVCSEAVLRNSARYSEAILGKSPAAYSAWILDAEKWGGEIEMNILSEYLGVQIAAIEVQSGRLYVYGNLSSPTRRIYLLYDGIHYDAIGRESAAQGGAVGGAGVGHVFDAGDAAVLQAVQQLAGELKKSKKFVDVSKFSVQCLVCGCGLTGQKEASAHAKETGHTNFSQI